MANNQEFKTLMLSHQTEGHRRRRRRRNTKTHTSANNTTNNNGDEQDEEIDDDDDDDDEEDDDAHAVGGGFKCCERGCKHFVYGFETGEALRRHMGLHEDDDAEAARREASTLQRRTSNMSLEDAGGPSGEESEDAAAAANGHAHHHKHRGHHSRTLSTGHGHGIASAAAGNGNGNNPGSPFAKRAMANTSDGVAAEKKRAGRLSLPAFAPAVVRTAGPCLRCKVLKKKVSFCAFRVWF
jgi:hypothetical protein